MFELGEVISYYDMCSEEGVNLQRGMNFHLRSTYSVILMSERPGAPYEDRTDDDGKLIIYEGHDIPNTKGSPEPKEVDQPMFNPSGSLCQNGLFFEAAKAYKNGENPEIVKVYEKIKSGIWAFNGYFKLIDAWLEIIDHRKVFKFKLELIENQQISKPNNKLEHNRVIPSWVKREVWKRDRGKCVMCGSKDNLHFDHIIPFSKGGSSIVPENIQLLCARHNLEKRDKIE
jgi:hypothetical protein